MTEPRTPDLMVADVFIAAGLARAQAPAPRPGGRAQATGPEGGTCEPSRLPGPHFRTRPTSVWLDRARATST